MYRLYGRFTKAMTLIKIFRRCIYTIHTNKQQVHWDRAGCPVPASGAFLTCSSLHNQVFLALSLCLAIPTLPCSTTAWNSSTMTHMSSHAQIFIYKEIQTRVAIKTLYITQLGLQPSVALYSYSNNAYLCLTSD